MAPVASGIADADQNRFLLPTGFFQGFRLPGVPLDGVVGVLKQVGRTFVLEMIHGVQ